MLLTVSVLMLDIVVCDWLDIDTISIRHVKGFRCDFCCHLPIHVCFNVFFLIMTGFHQGCVLWNVSAGHLTMQSFLKQFLSLNESSMFNKVSDISNLNGIT